MLVVGRFINGLCVGICSAQVPVYISELAPPSKRGRLVGSQQWVCSSQDCFYLRCALVDVYTGYHMGHSDHVLHILWLQLY